MTKSRIGDSIQSKIGMLLIGNAGAGKTWYALNSLYLKNEEGKPFKILFIDPEMGGADDYIKKLTLMSVNTKNIHIIYTTSLIETNKIIKNAAKKEPFFYEEGPMAGKMVLDIDGNQFVPDMIILDGASILYKTAVQGRREFSKKRATVRADKKDEISAAEKFVMVDGADIELKDYSQINFEGQNLLLNLTASGLHYIVTAREEEIVEKRIIKVNGQDKEVSISTGKFKPQGFKDMDYNIKTYARLYRDSEEDPIVKMYVRKDRTGTYPLFTPIEDPTILDYQSMINDNKDLENFVLANNWSEDIKEELMKNEREIVGTTIEDTESKSNSKSNEATIDLRVKKEEALKIVSTLTTPQKNVFKSLLENENLPRSSSSISTEEEMLKYIELAQQAATTV